MYKIIEEFSLDLSNLLPAGETRDFAVKGEEGATFSLEITNEDGYYYNFFTNAFQVIKAGLYNEIISVTKSYSGTIIFPVVTDDDHYDISLTADPNTTKHAEYNEVRFGDYSIDINSTTGSNSTLVTKVIYQFTNNTLTLQSFSPNSTIETTGTGSGTDTFSVSNGTAVATQAFSFSCAVNSLTKCYQIIKQPVSTDFYSVIVGTFGSAPNKIPGENIYPTATDAFEGDDINGAITSGSVVRMDNTDLSAEIKVGDKITTAVTTSTTDGVSTGIKVLLDDSVAGLMAVGDQVTGNAYLDYKVITVAALDPDGDNENEFSLSEAVTIIDGVTLTFSSKINRSLTTVTVVETSGVATDFTMSQAIQFRDNAPLTFYNQKNYRWPLVNVNQLVEGMELLPSTNILADTTISRYEDTITIFPDTVDQETIVINSAPAIATLNQTPTVVKGVVTVQPGEVTLDKQQRLINASGSVKIGGYGRNVILKTTGYDIAFTDLKIELTPITTTTTSTVSNSTSVPVASRNGILDDVSTVSGIGINAAVTAPTVDTGAGAVTGAGTLVLTAAQTLESGITLTFPNAGHVATITGNIEIVKAGTKDATVFVDVEKLLSIT